MTAHIRPYLLISLGLHLCLLLLLLLVKGPQVEDVVPRRVVVEFSQRPERTPRPLIPEEKRLPELTPRDLGESLKMQGPRTLALPGIRSTQAAPPRPSAASGGRRLSRAEKNEPLLPPASSPAAAPHMPAQLLVEELDSAAEPLPKEGADKARDGEFSADSGYSEAGALEWRGRERKLLKTAGITFPDILLKEGQEADVSAVFTVATNGQVIKVDIVRSSGYATVDAAVQRALYGYLFEPSGDSTEDVGEIQVRFRLERGD